MQTLYLSVYYAQDFIAERMTHWYKFIMLCVVVEFKSDGAMLFVNNAVIILSTFLIHAYPMNTLIYS